MSAADVRQYVERAIGKLSSNPLRLKLADDGIHEVDGRWWAVVDSSVEPRDRSQVWDSIAELEGIVEETAGPQAKILITAGPMLVA
jgi:hypothetical protein